MSASIAFLSRKWLMFKYKITKKISFYLMYVYHSRCIKKKPIKEKQVNVSREKKKQFIIDETTN